MKDLADLEQNFRDAVAKLPDYKRSAAWEYVKALRDDLDKLRKDRDDLADQLIRCQQIG